MPYIEVLWFPGRDDAQNGEKNYLNLMLEENVQTVFERYAGGLGS